MDEKERREFVTSLMGSLEHSVLAKVPDMPDEWDGHELRQYVADKAAEAVWRKMPVGRKREYNNTVMVKGL